MTAVAKSAYSSAQDDYASQQVDSLASPQEFTAPHTNEFSFNPFQDGRGNLTIITQRRAARLNAASIDNSEYEKLLNERANLVKSKFSDCLSAKQERRLRFVHWSLDRIQDARQGEAFDELESMIELYERVGQDIQNLLSRLDQNSGNRRKR